MHIKPSDFIPEGNSLCRNFIGSPVQNCEMEIVALPIHQNGMASPNRTIPA
jgi:hypothetical protein